MTITIRPPHTIKEYEALEWLQAEIWGPLGVTPVHFLLTIAKEGGIVLLALDGESPVGFAYAFPAITAEGWLKIASHQAGVLAAYQDQGVGYQLKLAQREATLAKGLNLISWTFDPLQGRNAAFNLRKLGAVCNSYFPDFYGEMDDDLNRGLPSDRFRVDWWIASEHVSRRLSGQPFEPELAGQSSPILNPAVAAVGGLRLPPDGVEKPTTFFCRVEIPVDLARLKAEAPDMALKWRLQTREIFEDAFRSGYTVINLLRQEGRNYYLLQKDWQVQ